MLSNYNFLFLSYLSGITEIGFVYHLWQNGNSYVFILLFALAYQLANSATSIIHIQHKIFLFIACTLALANIFVADDLLYLSSFFIVMYALQLERAEQKSNCSTLHKRVARVLGFLSCVLFSKCFLLFLICYIYICNIYVNKQNKITFLQNDSKNNGLQILMISHQMHYFVYCYTLLYIIAMQFNNIFEYALYFACGWLSYLLAEYFYKSTFSQKQIVVLGHSFLGISLLCLYFSYLLDSPFLLVLFWIATGLGGGSVFAIKKILNNNNIANNTIFFWENLGHILGVLLALMLAIFKVPLEINFLIACLFTFVVIFNSQIIGGQQ